MEIRTGTLSFSPARGSGPQTEQTFFNFTQPVRAAVAVLTGTNFGFSHDDHHLGQVNIRLSTSIDDDVVTVEGTLGVRDWSDDWDDDYQGNIQFVLLADLETGFVPSNLSITGVEYNQTIQFFRTLLDPATAQPDNSIGLIAGKNTILRVYIDTQTDPARPTIADISGLLEIRLPGSATWNPISPLNAPILSKRDSAIRRGNASDTLNFLIRGAFSTDNVDFRLRVFDSAHAGQPGYTSGTVQGTLQFTTVEPLRVRGVGVHYTGEDSSGNPIDVPAPDVAALRSTLSFVLKTYPVGQIFITGFDVIDYDGDFTALGGVGGCGPGWDDLINRLREMQGDIDDVYYGLVPLVPLGQAVGCGGGDGRVAAGIVNNGQIAVQGMAHAFGRDHAPCGNPDNPDPNYPTYDALPMGSIGEFGIDDRDGVPFGQLVKDPASTFDFMSYCGPVWVSPYTYEGLRQNFLALKAAQIDSRTEPSQHLFLNLRIYRGGKVEILPSFHYLSLPTVKRGRWTPYTIELRDCHNKPLHAQRVWLTDPHKDLDSARLEFYKPIPYHKDTARVVVTCDANGDCEQKELLTVDVPCDPPIVRIVCPEKHDQLSGKIRVAWEAHFDDKPLHYLLRYSNDGGRSWRAVAPRLHVTEYVVDLDRLPGGEKCQFQVLATEGIRTGMAVSEPFNVPQKPRETTIIALPTETVVPGQTVTLKGESFSPDTGSAHPFELQWHSDLDGLLGTGHEINVSTLRPGLHKISLQAPDGYGRESITSIQIEVKTPTPRKHTSLTHPDHTSKDHDSGRVPSKPKGGDKYGN